MYTSQDFAQNHQIFQRHTTVTFRSSVVGWVGVMVGYVSHLLGLMEGWLGYGGYWGCLVLVVTCFRQDFNVRAQPKPLYDLHFLCTTYLLWSTIWDRGREFISQCKHTEVIWFTQYMSTNSLVFYGLSFGFLFGFLRWDPYVK